MSAAERTKVGFVGAGVIASRHLGNLLGFPDVLVVAVADVDPRRGSEFARRFDGHAYPSATAMLEGERLDAVYMCVPPAAHGDPERAVIEHALPFFVEKPLATELEAAERIAAGVERAGLVTAAGYHWRYLSTTERARELLAERPARLALGYWLDMTPPPEWWRQEALSGGQMVEQTTHIFDLARHLVGDVESVFAVGSRTPRAGFPDADVLDVSTAALRFRSGAVGAIASTCLLEWPHRIGLHLFSEGMAIELSEFEMMVDVGRGRPVEKAEGDPFVREDRAFIDGVRGDPSGIRVPYAEALETHRLVTTAARSARERIELRAG